MSFTQLILCGPLFPPLSYLCYLYILLLLTNVNLRLAEQTCKFVNFKTDSLEFASLQGVNIYIVYLFKVIKVFTLVTKDVKTEVDLQTT